MASTGHNTACTPNSTKGGKLHPKYCDTSQLQRYCLHHKPHTHTHTHTWAWTSFYGDRSWRSAAWDIPTNVFIILLLMLLLLSFVLQCPSWRWLICKSKHVVVLHKRNIEYLHICVSRIIEINIFLINTRDDDVTQHRAWHYAAIRHWPERFWSPQLTAFTVQYIAHNRPLMKLQNRTVHKTR